MTRDIVQYDFDEENNILYLDSKGNVIHMVKI